jgi:L-lactate dehydrogenase
VSDRQSSLITKVGIVGAGMVGASCAYALMQRGIAADIVLVDTDVARAEGEAMDLNHGVPFVQPCRIRAGGLNDLANADVTIFTAGSNQRPGESRLDLLQRNAAIIRELAPQIMAIAPQTILVIATNPVDILTQIAHECSNSLPGQIIGSGTILDTARLRALLADHYQVDPHSVHAMIIGEHGDSSLPVWSAANIGGVSLADFTRAHGPTYNPETLNTIFHQARDAAYEIIKRKRATYYAIGLGLVTIIEAIVRDQQTILTVSSPLSGQYGVSGTSLSLPSIVGHRGIEDVLTLALKPEEIAAFQRSAAILSERYHQLGGA